MISGYLDDMCISADFKNIRARKIAANNSNYF